MGDRVGEDRLPLPDAADVANDLVDRLWPFCHRIEIAGSIRRRRPTIGDIELVASPRMETVPVGLFDTAEVSALDRGVDALIEAGVLTAIAGGDRYRKLRHVASGLQVDLFVVRPPAQWGVIFLIRTGPAAYSQGFVTDIKRLGFHVAEGALHRGRGFGCPKACEVIATLEEAVVYAAIGHPFAGPLARDGLAGLR